MKIATACYYYSSYREKYIAREIREEERTLGCEPKAVVLLNNHGLFRDAASIPNRHSKRMKKYFLINIAHLRYLSFYFISTQLCTVFLEIKCSQIITFFLNMSDLWINRTLFRIYLQSCGPKNISNLGVQVLFTLEIFKCFLLPCFIFVFTFC